MEIIEIIAAGVKAYLEREKAKEEQQRSMDIINAINNQILQSRNAIIDAIKDLEINRLTGLYLGQVENFKEYEPKPEHQQLLNNIAYDLNEEIYGPLIQYYHDEDKVEKVRQIVRLMSLVVNLRALVLSELKFKYNDNRDDHLLEQLNHVKSCCAWLTQKQDERNVRPLLQTWLNCERSAHPDKICLPIWDESGDLVSPTTCCAQEFYAYKAPRVLLTEDIEQGHKVDDLINHLQGVLFLAHWNFIKSKQK
ncbi:hypothetical protein AT278_16725 [Bacillus cereus]|uniref:hypothetical protein n=1 Tax=Bacillus TaxID=1386 RepID=UPI00077A2FCD|nr:hypothetical protein [Bacillus cereus]KXY55858.1 hypothetical protein AT278_16725 [Bacillus cereus]